MDLFGIHREDLWKRMGSGLRLLETSGKHVEGSQERLEVSWGRLDDSWRRLEGSWRPLGALGALWVVLEASVLSICLWICMYPLAKD